MARGKKISDLDSGVAPLDGDEVVIHRGGKNYRLNAEALNSLGMLAKNNLSDIGDAATALANLNGLAATAERGLSIYDGAITVDSDNGDYTTVTAALASASAGDTIHVLSDTDEPGTITMTQSQTIVVWPEVTWKKSTSSGHMVVVNGGGAAITVEIHGHGMNSKIGPHGTGNTLLRVEGAGDKLVLENLRVGEGFGWISVYMLQASQIAQIRNCIIGDVTTGTFGFAADDALAATTIFSHSVFEGSNGSVATTPGSWSNAPFYHCVLNGTIFFTTFEASNNSNVEL